MRRREALGAGRVSAIVCAFVCALVCAFGSAAQAAAGDEAMLRWRAPIVVDKPGAFVQLPLPASAYAHAEQIGLQDLRVVDAAGSRVPFALLEPRADTERSIELQRDVALYPLPPRPAASGDWVVPVDLTVEGNRVTLRRTAATQPPDAGRSGGWLIDTGDPAARPAGEPAPHALRLQWSGPTEFSAGYRLDLSDDLRSWRRGGAGQLMALASPGGALTQPLVALPLPAARFVRMVWDDPNAAPLVTAVQALAAKADSVVHDAPSELSFAAVAGAGDKSDKTDKTDKAPPGALVFDLGGALPLVRIDLRLAAGTRIAPVRIETRLRERDPWATLASAVFYRIERGDAVSQSPALRIDTRTRFVRIVPDERAAPLAAATTKLVVQARLASVVYAAQGPAPHALLAGSSKAAAGALPIGTVVPALDDERPRFGHAALGEWQAVPEAVAQADAEQRQAALRPWLLWGVLLGGVAMLALLVWRLVRSQKA